MSTLLPPSNRDLLPQRPQARQRSSGTAVRRLICLLLIVLGVAALFVARPKTTRAGASPTRPELGTSLWSARRSPQSVVEAVGVQRLGAELSEVTREINTSCVTVDAPGFGTVTAIEPERPLLAASTMKVLTATAALASLGPEYRYTTRVVSGARPNNGVVDKAWFIGSGDPVLHTDDYQAVLDANPATRGNAATSLEKLAGAVAASGTKTINTLLIDDTRYDNVRYLPTWRANYKTEGQVGSLGALISNGGFSSWDGVRVPSEDPGLETGGRLVELLKARGVTVNAVRRGTVPGEGTELGAVQSPPLRDILGEMLRTSDNATAEMVTRELAAKPGQVGSTPAGVEVLKQQLTARGISLKGTTILDGSGLSRDNLLTCQALRQAIEAGRTPGNGRLDDLLAVGGVSGTLASRFQGGPLQGKLFAKTGTLSGATGLTGIVDNYRTLPFAFIANGGFTEGGGAALQSRVVGAVSRFPAGPGAAVLVPAPDSPCTPPACR